MKECPQCHESFSDDQRFCDMDGTELVDDTLEVREALVQSSIPKQQRDLPGFLTMGVVGLLVGVCICLLVYAFLILPSANETATEETTRSSNRVAATRQNQLAAAPIPERPLESPSPVESVTPEPSPSPAATAPPVPVETPSASLNEGAISTGSKRESRESGHALIKMKDGSSVEADAAWEDSQGIWYRRGALVSFVERDKVEKITGRPEPPPPAPESPKR